MRTVLIIEDDPDTLQALREALEFEGFCVFSTTSGREGLDLLASLAPPVVVLLDQNMPIMSGEEFLRAKKGNARLAQFPVIVISAVVDRTRAMGANAFLSKPLDFNSLVRRLHDFFQGKPLDPPGKLPLAGTSAHYIFERAEDGQAGEASAKFFTLLEIAGNSLGPVCTS